VKVRELRAWDEKYKHFWYLNKNFYFECETAVCSLNLCPFEMKDIEQNTWKKDKNGVDIYVGDRLKVNMSIITVGLFYTGLWWYGYKESDLEVIGHIHQ
jgi:hypothetical protein